MGRVTHMPNQPDRRYHQNLDIRVTYFNQQLMLTRPFNFLKTRASDPRYFGQSYYRAVPCASRQVSE